MSGRWTKPRHTAVRILRKKTGHGIVFLCKGALSPKKAFCCLNGFGFINLEAQESKFPMVFNMFLNMFWIAEGFGYMGVSFNIGLSTICCLIFSLE